MANNTENNIASNSYVYTEKDITFHSVKKPLLEFQNVIGRKDRIKFNGNDVYQINDDKPFINAVDIDWNGAEVDVNKQIDTTADLLEWIKHLKTSSSEINLAIDDKLSSIEFSSIISAFRWYHPGDIPKAPINRNNPPDYDAMHKPIPSDSYSAYPDYWSNIIYNKPTNGEWVLWCSYAKEYNTIDYITTIGIWSTPVQISGVDGTPGEDGKAREFIYKCFTELLSNLGAPNSNYSNDKTSSFLRDDYVPEEYGWSDNPEGISEEYPYEYTCYRDYKNGLWSRFSDPILWSNWGRVGIDGDGVEYVFIGTEKRTYGPVFVLPDNDYVDSSHHRHWYDDEFLPQVLIDEDYAECTDDPPSLSEEFPYVWVGKRRKKDPDSTGKREWNKYEGSMKLWAKWGFDGNNDIRVDENGNLVVNGLTIDTGSTGTGITNLNPCNVNAADRKVGMIVYYEGNVYVYTGNNNDTYPCEGWRVVGESNGEGNYLHIAYAKDVLFITTDGIVSPISATGFIKTPPSLSDWEEYEWIGICVNDEIDDPLDFRSYKWNRIGGSDGNGAEWIYIRTSKNIAPGINNLQIPGDNHGDPNNDEFYPLVVFSNGLTSSDVEPYEEGHPNVEYRRWKDDSGGPNEDWPFRWRAQRKYIDGHWRNFGTVCSDGNYAVSDFKLMLDNDTVILDDDTDSDSIKTLSETKLSLWEGSTNVMDGGRYSRFKVSVSHNNSSDFGQHIRVTKDNGNSDLLGGGFVEFNSSSVFRIEKKSASTSKLPANKVDSIKYTVQAFVGESTTPAAVVSRTQSLEIIDINDGVSYKLVISPNSLRVEGNTLKENTFSVSAIACSKGDIIDNIQITNILPTSPDTPVSGNYYIGISGNLGYTFNNETVTIGSTDVSSINSIVVNLYYVTSSAIFKVDSETIDFAIPGPQGPQGGQGNPGTNGTDGTDGSNAVTYQLVCNPSIVNFRRNSTGDTLIGEKTITCELHRIEGTTTSIIESPTIYYKPNTEPNNWITYNSGVTITPQDNQSLFLIAGYGSLIPISNLTNIQFKSTVDGITYYCDVPIICDGINATSNIKLLVVRLYKRDNSTPGKPQSLCTYTFSSNSINPTPLDGWSMSIPGGNNLLYLTAQTVYTNDPSVNTITLQPSLWSDPIAVRDDGLTELPKILTVFLYLRNNDIVQLNPPSQTTYTFSSNSIVFNGSNNGWGFSINGTGKYLYMIYATAVSYTDTDIILSTEWSTPQIIGINGDKGDKGDKGDTGRMFYSMGIFDPEINYRDYCDSFRTPMIFYDDEEWNSALNMNGSYYYLNDIIKYNYNSNNLKKLKFPNEDNSGWLKASNFGVVMTQALFSDFAKIGAGLISGDYLFTSNGTIQENSYNDGVHYNSENDPPYMRFDSKFPDGKESNYNIKFLDGFIVNSTVLSSSENDIIITKPFYMVKDVEYLFNCEQTDETVEELSGNMKHRDLAYSLLCLIDNSLCEIIQNAQNPYNFYSNGDTYSYTPSKSGYYIIKARSVTYQQSEPDLENNIDGRASVEGKILNIILNINNNQQQPLFVPNWWVDLKTGKMSAAKGNFVVESDGSVIAAGGNFTINPNGNVVSTKNTLIQNKILTKDLSTYQGGNPIYVALMDYEPGDVPNFDANIFILKGDKQGDVSIVLPHPEDFIGATLKFIRGWNENNTEHIYIYYPDCSNVQTGVGTDQIEYANGGIYDPSDITRYYNQMDIVNYKYIEFVSGSVLKIGNVEYYQWIITNKQ